MTELTFEKFNKIGRLNKLCTITEKVDGTNAQVVFGENGGFIVGSRKREIFPNGTDGMMGCDNHGFAKWVYGYHNYLFEYLGEGRHFGEWAGKGIQKRYEDAMPEKRFYLFNSFRFGTDENPIPDELWSIGLRVVPILYEGMFSTGVVNDNLLTLGTKGSQVCDCDNPEGIVVYHHGMRTYAKVTFEYDNGKWQK